MDEVKPNFLIVGAPRCGTTAMWSYLKQHPDVFLSKKKELGHFGSDMPAVFRSLPSREEYLSKFVESKGAQRVGEATPVYLFSEKAAQEIYEFNPRMKIIIMLRRPADLIHSLWSQSLKFGFEVIADLDAALAAEKDRRQGRRIPPGTPVEPLLYRQWARYTDQVKRYLDLFGWDNTHIIIYDDFKNDTPLVYRQTLEFLDLDPAVEPDFNVVHTQQRVRVVWLQRFLRNKGRLKSTLRPLVPERVRIAARSWLTRSNLTNQRWPAMRAETKRQLREEFTEEILRLSDLLGRDLSNWLALDADGENEFLQESQPREQHLTK